MDNQNSLEQWELEGHSMEYIMVVGSTVGNRKWWRMMMRSKWVTHMTKVRIAPDQ